MNIKENKKINSNGFNIPTEFIIIFIIYIYL